MKLDLLIKEIKDAVVQENFSRLKRDLESQQILDGQWQFYEVEFQTSGVSLPIKHNLSFVPIDVIVLSIEGNHNLYFINQKFDSTNMYITVSGACRVRFLAGRYKNRSATTKEYALQPPNFEEAAGAACDLVSICDFPIQKEEVSYNGDGTIATIVVYKADPYVAADRIAQTDFTYNADLTPATETSRVYDPTDGVTILKTITRTYTYAAGVLQDVLQVVT